MRIYGFSTQDNGCGKYRVWQPLDMIKERGLAEVRREPDAPQHISIERTDEIFRWADVVYCQPFSETWAASIFMAARDVHGKKLVVDLDDNVWAVHPMNVGPVGDKLFYLKSHFDGNFSDFWDLQPISKKDIPKYRDRIDGTIVEKPGVGIFFMHSKRPDVKSTVEFMLRGCDAVTTTNEVLANVIRKHTEAPVFVIPNCLDLRKWRKPKLADDIWIGWCGSVSHYPDLQPLMPVFDRLMAKYPNLHVQIMGSSFDYLFPPKKTAKMLPVGGYGPDEQGMWCTSIEDSGERWPGRMRFDKPVKTQDFEEWICSNWQSHIAIAPLEANDFNDSKSELKWLEYTALGVPTIASDFGPYKRARVPVRCKSLHEWQEMLSLLIEGKAKSHAGVNPQYDIRNRVKDWMEVFECVYSSPGALASSAHT